MKINEIHLFIYTQILRMNSPNLPPSDQFVLRRKNFEDLLLNKYYAVKIGNSEPFVAQITSKDDETVGVQYIEDDYQELIHRDQTIGRAMPAYEFLAPAPIGGRRRKTRRRQRRGTRRHRL